MTSALKFGVLGLGAVGIAVGAYLVNSGKSNDAAAPSASPVAGTSGVEGPAAESVDAPTGTPSLQPALPEPAVDAPAGALVRAEEHTDRVASPAPLGLRDSGEDTERSWRPRPLETSVAHVPPITRDEVLADIARTDEPAESDSSPLADGPALACLAIDTETDRMALGEQGPATQPWAGSEPVREAPARADATTVAEEKMTIHVVQPGDTFSALAVKYLGSARHVNLIAKANPKLNPNRLYVGTKLKIPAAPEAAKAPAAPITAAGQASGSPAVSVSARPRISPPPVDPARAYTVKPNDSWTKLAQQFLGDGNEWTRLFEHNKERFPHSRTLHPGMVIEIPPRSN